MIANSVNPTEILGRLQNDFELETGATNWSWTQLREIVARKVAELMELNTGEFFNLLYIMDISEEKIKHAIQFAQVPYLAIADIIIEREIQKVQTRKQYAQYFDNCDEDAEKW